MDKVERIAELEALCRAKSKEIDRLREEIRKRAAQYEETYSDLARSVHQQEVWRKKYEGADQAYDTSVRKLMDELAETKATVEPLLHELRTMAEARDQLVAELAVTTKQVELSNRERDELRHDLDLATYRASTKPAGSKPYLDPGQIRDVCRCQMHPDDHVHLDEPP